MIVGGKILSFWTPGKEYWAQLPENFISLEKVFLFNYSGYKHSSLSLYIFIYITWTPAPKTERLD